MFCDKCNSADNVVSLKNSFEIICQCRSNYDDKIQEALMMMIRVSSKGSSPRTPQLFQRFVVV